MTEDLQRIGTFLKGEGFDFGELNAGMIDAPHIQHHGHPKGWMKLERRGDGILCVAMKWNESKAAQFFTSGTPLTPKDLKEIRKRRSAAEKALTEQHFEKKRIVGQRFAEMSIRSIHQPSHYLKRKNLSTPDGMITVMNTDDNQRLLIVPMFDENGELWNMQTIYADGTKLYFTGARTKGLHHPVRGLGSTVYLAEGVATALSIKASTGNEVVIAFSVSRMEDTLKILLGRVRPEDIIIAADFDGLAQTNAGMKKAKSLAMKYKVRVVVPVEDFKAAAKLDFADLDPAERATRLSTTYGWEDLHVFEFDGPKVTKDRAEPESVVELTETQGDAPVTEKIDYSWIIAPPVKQPFNPNALKANLLPDRKGENGEGGVKATLSNFETLLNHMGATVRYNVISKRQEWFIPGVEASPDNYDQVLYSHFEDACARVGFPDAKLQSYITNLCDRNQFNPVLTWIESKPWDGRSRLEDLYATAETLPEDEELKRTFIRYWLIMAVAAASRPQGIAAPGMLVFQGDQFMGKTKWLMSLVPEELRLAKDSVVLNLDKLDTIREAIQFWLVELGELDGTLSRSEQNALKAWITKQSDIIRAPYAKASNTFARRTVFFGSVNKEHFLTDPTGNRRYWVVGVKKLRHDHGIDMQQLWAEVQTFYKAGEKWWPSDQNMALMNDSNERFTEMDPLEDQLRSLFDWEVHGSDMTATQLCQELGFEQPTKWQINAAAGWAKKLNKGKKPVNQSHKSGRKLWIGRKRR